MPRFSSGSQQQSAITGYALEDRRVNEQKRARQAASREAMARLGLGASEAVLQAGLGAYATRQRGTIAQDDRTARAAEAEANRQQQMLIETGRQTSDRSLQEMSDRSALERQKQRMEAESQQAQQMAQEQYARQARLDAMNDAEANFRANQEQARFTQQQGRLSEQDAFEREKFGLQQGAEQEQLIAEELAMEKARYLDTLKVVAGMAEAGAFDKEDGTGPTPQELRAYAMALMEEGGVGGAQEGGDLPGAPAPEPPPPAAGFRNYGIPDPQAPPPGGLGVNPLTGQPIQPPPPAPEEFPGSFEAFLRRQRGPVAPRRKAEGNMLGR